MRDITITLSNEDAYLIAEALEAAEYWAYGAHGDPELPIKDGFLWLPGDYKGEGPDPFWPTEPDEGEQEAIDQVKRLRQIGAKITNEARTVRATEALMDSAGVTVSDVEQIHSSNSMQYGDSSWADAEREAIWNALENLDYSMDNHLEDATGDVTEEMRVWNSLKVARRMLQDGEPLALIQHERGEGIAKARDILA